MSNILCPVYDGNKPKYLAGAYVSYAGLYYQCFQDALRGQSPVKFPALWKEVFVRGSGYITSVSDTSNIDLTVTGSDLTADLTSIGGVSGSYTLSNITVDGKGRVTAAANGSALSTTLTNTHILVGNASNVATDVALSGDATLANTGAMTLASVNSNVGTYGSATKTVTVTANAKGLITAISEQTIAIPIGVLTCNTGNGNSINLSATQYAQFGFGNSVSNSEAARQCVIPFACTLKNFYVRTQSSQSGTGDLVITIRQNTADTAITLTVTAGSAAGTFSDTTHSFAVAAGDLVSIKNANAATAASATIYTYSLGMYYP